MSQAEVLYNLQKIDLQIIRVKKRLNEIALLLKDNVAVTEAQTQVAAAEKKLIPLKTQARNLEFDIQSTVEKSKGTEELLYSGRVKNPKEMREMQQEIDSLKKRRGDLEDRLLEVMMTVEEAEGELQNNQSNLITSQSAWANQNQALLDEQAKLQTQLTAEQERRKTALPNVKPESLKIYDTLKGKKANHPIALMQDRSCAACGIEQTLAIVTEAKRGETLVYCLNCERILVPHN